MDIQMPITITPVSAGTNAAASGSKVASAEGAGATTGGEGTFTQVLQGQMTQGSATDTDADASALSLADLMGMLVNLPVQMQQVLQGQGDKSDSEVLPELVLQAMNNDAGLADRLLQDAGLQQWLGEASELLQALTGGTTSTAAQPLASTTVQAGATQLLSQQLQAQQTLLSLTSMLNQQPNNAVVQHLAQEFQQVMQPLMPLLIDASKTEQTQVLQGAAEGVSEEADVINALAVHTGLSGKTDATKNRESFVGQAMKSKSENASAQNSIAAQGIAQVGPSPLELLTAKSMIHAPSLVQLNAEPLVEMPAAEPVIIVSENVTPTVSFPDMTKLSAPSTPTATAEAASIHADNFAEEMSQHMLKNMKVTLTEGFSEAKLSLFPKNLGHVDVKITMHEGQLVAQFAADTLAGKQMLESQLPQLRQALQSQGLQVEKLEVTQNQSMQSGMFQDQRHQQSQQPFQQQNKGRSARYVEDSGEFVQEITAANQSPSKGFGTSIDVTA